MAHKLRPMVSGNDHIQGLPGAPLELVEYGDYQCPQCGRAYPIIKRIQEEMGKDMKFVYRNFPLSDTHPHAFPAAVAAEAASRQGAFWAMHDIIFENQELLEGSLKDMPFVSFAQQLGLDIETFENDLEDPKLAEKVDDDFTSGVRSGVNGTPGFFINGERYDGSWEESALLAQLQKILTKG
jgi:protein-disulfide isomerase